MNESIGISTVIPTTTGDYVYYTIQKLDIVIGTLYLLFGLFGIYSNAKVLCLFWRARKTVKIYPFTLCALVLAANDLLFCTLGISPYAVLILAKRPQADSFPGFLCKIFGFVNNFSDRFAWFDITCIMVFRCVTIVITLRARLGSVSYRPFIYIISLLALLQGSISVLPFFNLEIIPTRYEYFPNLGECIYAVNGTLAPWMIVVIDVLWWGPFLACILSCAIFFICMKLHEKKSAIRRSGKTSDARKKTAFLTAFFITCYFPKAFLIFMGFLMNTERHISWEWFYRVMGGPDRALKLYVYLNLMFNLVIPAGRAAFTPAVLGLETYIKTWDTSRQSNLMSPRSNFSRTMTTRSPLVTLRSKFMKSDSSTFFKLSPKCGAKAEQKGMRSQLV